MKNNQRDLLHYELKFKSSSSKVRVGVSIKDVVHLLEQAVDDQRASHLINNETQRLIIRDIKKVGKDHVALFVALTDPTIPNAVYTDQSSLKSREIQKGRDEAGELGCHLLLKLDDDPLEDKFIPAYLEQVTGLSASLVEGLLNAIIRGVHKDEDGAFEGENIAGKLGKDGKAKLVKYRPIAEFWGVPADDLKKSINKGKVQSLTLVKWDQRQSFGGRQYLVPRKQQLTIKLDLKKMKSGNLFDDMMAGLKAESKDWPGANIRFETAGGEKVRAVVDTNTGLVAQERFIKKTPIEDISPVLANSAPAVVDHLTCSVSSDHG